ncbi:MAG: hypothetical protein ACTSQO_14345 [Candidatus Helarchaeota archaeon]
MIKVEIESDGEGNILLSLLDANRIIKRNVFTERFIDNFYKVIKENSAQYKKLEKLRNVIYDMGIAEIENNSFILAKSKVGKMDFGLLLNKEKFGGQTILGIWPKDFYESIRDDEEIFEYFIYRLINTPEFFDKVILYTPSKEIIKASKADREKLKAKAVAKPKPKHAKVALKPEAQPVAQPIAQPTAEPTPIPQKIPSKPPVPTISKPPEPPISQPPTPTATPLPKPQKITPPSPTPPPQYVTVDDRCPNCKKLLSAPRLKILHSGQSTFCPSCLKIIHPPPSAVAKSYAKEEAKKIEYICPYCGFPIPYTLLNEINQGKKVKCVGCGKELDKSVLS